MKKAPSEALFSLAGSTITQDGKPVAKYTGSAYAFNQRAASSA